jgi:predicted permease
MALQRHRAAARNGSGAKNQPVPRMIHGSRCARATGLSRTRDGRHRMDGFLRDLRFTLRNMGRSPGLAAVIAVSLALGIGANTAIFSLIRAVMLESLPVRDPGRLVLMHWHADAWPRGLNQSGSGGPSNPAYKAASRSLPFPFARALAEETALFESVFAFAPLGPERQNTTLADDSGGERVDGEMVSGGYFRGLGVAAAHGRLLTRADETGRAQVAVLSHAYWRRRFGADPSILGRPVSINHLPFTIVGVAAPGFYGVQPGRSPDVWVPMLDRAELAPWGYRPADAPSLLEVRGYWWAQVMARLKDGVDEREARAKTDALFQSFVAGALPELERDTPPHIGFEPGAGGIDTLRADYRDPLLLLMAMVGLVLLIACANVAVLLLSRAMARRREFALRISLGAGRARLIRQLLTESLLMAAAGGALGVLAAGWTSRGLMFLVPPDRRPSLDNEVDAFTLAFAAAVSIATALLFGLAPAVVATRVDLLPAMKATGHGSVAAEHPAHRIWSTTFVVVQIALSLVLLVGAALFVRTLANLQRQALGVDDARLLVFGADASQNGYSGDRLVALYSEVIRRLEAVPGAEAASAARLRLFSGWVSNGAIRAPGVEVKASMNLNTNSVGPGFARAVGQRLLAGRDLTWSDVDARRRVAVVNEAMARHFFGDVDVVGRRYSHGTTYDQATDYEIVGVVSNAKYSEVRGDFPRTAYVPFTGARSSLRGLYFHVRAAGDPLALAASVRAAVRSIDPAIPITGMDTMAAQVGDSLWQERLFARITTVFGALALTLASIGLYGTISYGVGRRRGEIAVRMALGARYRQVLWMILRRAVALAVAGVAAGVPLSLWAGRYLSSILFGLTPRDPATLAFTAAVLIGVATLAGYLPARRAALVDPAHALKQD